MSLAEQTIKQQKCKTCNIRYEQKDAHLGYIVETEGFSVQVSATGLQGSALTILHPASSIQHPRRVT